MALGDESVAHGGDAPEETPNGFSMPGRGCSHCPAAFFSNERLDSHMDERHPDKPKAVAWHTDDHVMDYYPSLHPAWPHLSMLHDKKTNQHVVSMVLGHDGELQGIETHPERRREGLATKLWDMATEHAKQNQGRGVPMPTHSNLRTPEGNAWATSTGAAGVPAHSLLSSRQMMAMPVGWK